jgi:cytosine/adenosine deaminase-related metal-dependent hydrolase
MWGRPVSFVNARVLAEQAEARSVRFASQVLALDESPARGDRVIDLAGAFVLPGLFNAHDHLELNHYGRQKFRPRYANVSEWIDDMRPRLQVDAGLRAGQRHSLADRLFIGVLKNLLAGVSTVAHHNPLYRDLRARSGPIRIVQRYGWAHSFALEHAPAGARGEPGGEVAERFRATPPDAPFFVHLGEGVDAAAGAELRWLDALGCLAPNAVLVHGVGINPAEWPRLARRGAALVWCPASNLFLFRRTAAIRALLDVSGPGGPPRLALGTDSRLSGGRDLLEELNVAADTGAASPQELLRMVTVGGADVVRSAAGGRIGIGLPADFVVIPSFAADPARSLLATTRRDVRLVVVDGRPIVGDESLESAFRARGVRARPLCVDGTRKVAGARLVQRIASCAITEPGVRVV